ncbi:hypothetical protein BDV96DRAFT_461964, partial [Lophiotrema nucula]
FDRSSLVNVIVGAGEAQKEFVAYGPIISARSEFFRRALNGKWEEAETRVVKLPEDDPETFRLWLNFVYTNNLATNGEDGKAYEEMSIEEAMAVRGAEYIRLSKLYVLAEKLQDCAVKNAVLTAIWDLSEEGRTCGSDGKWVIPWTQEIGILYEGTPQNDSIRRLVVDLWSAVSTESMIKYYENLP